VSAGRFRSSVTSQRAGKIEESAASGCNTAGWLRKLKSLPPAKRWGRSQDCLTNSLGSSQLAGEAMQLKSRSAASRSLWGTDCNRTRANSAGLRVWGAPVRNVLWMTNLKAKPPAGIRD
jgi:hypothetical protein